MEKENKFYFAGSIRGGREDVELYRNLIDYIQTFGKVLTEHIALDSLKPSGKVLSNTAVRCFSVAAKPASAAKIYFAASIRAGRDDAKIYKELIKYLKVHVEVLSETEQLGPNIEREAKGEIDKGDKFIHDRDMAWLDESDALIAEVTQPSLGVGYEIGRAIERGKTILCLFRPESGRVLSAMIRGAVGENLCVMDYQGEEEAKKIIRGFLYANNLI